MLSSLRQHLCCHWLRLPNKVEAKRIMVHHVHLTNPEVRELQRRVEIVEYVWASDLAADFCSVEIAVAAEAASFLWKWSGESS